nr:hypothetical protein [uncultured Fluviicola sp.]
MDWTDLIKLFGVGAFPWISELRKLDIHFEQPGIKTSSIFNFFASLFAMGIFAYSFYVNPYQLIQLPNWIYFLVGACILTILYFSFYIYFKESVKKGMKKGIVIVQFIIYILIFCSLTTAFGLLKVFKDYVVIDGKVLDSKGKTTDADFNIYFNDGRQIIFKSKQNGTYIVMFKINELEKITKIEVRNDSGDHFDVNTFGEISVFNYLNEIKLIKD